MQNLLRIFLYSLHCHSKFFTRSFSFLCLSFSCSLDCARLKPIYKNAPNAKCSYCGSNYSPDFKGKLCVTCGIANVGIDTLGLVTLSASARK